LERLSGAINSLDPEVKLAIRFSLDKSKSQVITTALSNDDQEADEFISSRGFEFIDGDNDSRAGVLDSDDDSTGKSHLSVNVPKAPTTTNVISSLPSLSAPKYQPKLMLGFCDS
jgi:hypothetical protein